MHSKLNLARLIVFFLLFSPAVFSQSNFDTDKFSNLKLHIDKTYFLPGESVFFKAYFVSADTTQNFSCTVSLIDENGKRLQSKQLALISKMGSSFFILPDIDAAKFYSIQYYLDTKGDPVIYSKHIVASIATAANATNAIGASAATFYPEAANVVAALPRVIYFKIAGFPATAFPLQGAVTNTAGDTLIYFTTTNTGAARVEINDSDTAPLFLVYEYANQQYQKEIALDVSPASPALMNLYPTANGVICRIRTQVADSFFIRVEHNGISYYYGAVYLQAGDDFSKVLNDSMLATGVNLFSLSSNGKQVASRTYYVEPLNSFGISNVKFLKDDSLKIVFNNRATGIYSVCAKTLKRNDVKASVDDARNKAADDIELQLLPWAKKINLPKPADSIRIILKDDNDKNLVTGGLVNLFITTSDDKFIIEKRTNSSGELYLDRRMFIDSVTIAFFPKDKNRLNHILTPVYQPEIVFTDSAAIEASAAAYLLMLADTSAGTMATDFKKSKAMMLDEVVLKTKKARVKSKLEIVEETYASGMFMSNIHNIAKFDMINDYQGQALGDVSSFLSGRIPKENYLAYLNESFVDMAVINSIPLSEVAFISVMGRNFTTLSSKGMTIIVYTKKGVSVGDNRDFVKRNTIKISGYATDKDYFNPLFANSPLDNKYRTTLYWNSNTVLVNAGEMKIKLPAKPAGPIEIRIMGFDENGEFVSIKKIIGAVE
ncbi:MAG: hypothetical protein IPP72_17230 [Chitinophagaceae bacterium]|nr:hypothetical protein [Chitinophagaceae bacterium]